MLRSALGLLLICAAVCSPAQARDRPRVWLGLGVGGGGGQDAEGGGVMAELVFQKRAHYFATRGLLFIDPYESGGTIGELGVLYGRAAKRPWGHAALAGGLAFTGVDPCPDTGSGSCTSIGVPVVAEAALKLGSVLGVGAQAFANLNPTTVYGGVVVFLQLGWMP